MRTLLAALILVPGVALAQGMSGPAKIVDGNTLAIGSTNVRLFGIKAPEKEALCSLPSGEKTACGFEATAGLRKLISGGPVTCQPQGSARNGQTVAVCSAGAVSDIGSEMVARGYAAEDASGGRYASQQQQAKASHLGIWNDGRVSPNAAKRSKG